MYDNVIVVGHGPLYFIFLTFTKCTCSHSTMERVVREGTVATAATYAHMFSSLPSCGRPTRLMVYDLHTLQNRFYLV